MRQAQVLVLGSPGVIPPPWVRLRLCFFSLPGFRGRFHPPFVLCLGGSNDGGDCPIFTYAFAESVWHTVPGSKKGFFLPVLTHDGRVQLLVAQVTTSLPRSPDVGLLQTTKNDLARASADNTEVASPFDLAPFCRLRRPRSKRNLFELDAGARATDTYRSILCFLILADDAADDLQPRFDEVAMVQPRSESKFIRAGFNWAGPTPQHSGGKAQGVTLTFA